MTKYLKDCLLISYLYKNYYIVLCIYSYLVYDIVIHRSFYFPKKIITCFLTFVEHIHDIRTDIKGKIFFPNSVDNNVVLPSPGVVWGLKSPYRKTLRY